MRKGIATVALCWIAAIRAEPARAEDPSDAMPALERELDMVTRTLDDRSRRGMLDRSARSALRRAEALAGRLADRHLTGLLDVRTSGPARRRHTAELVARPGGVVRPVPGQPESRYLVFTEGQGDQTVQTRYRIAGGEIATVELRWKKGATVEWSTYDALPVQFVLSRAHRGGRSRTVRRLSQGRLIESQVLHTSGTATIHSPGRFSFRPHTLELRRFRARPPAGRVARTGRPPRAR